MSIRVDSSPLIASSVVLGDSGLGVLASEVPSTGEHGPGYMYDQITALSLTTEEVRGLITAWPASGTLIAYEDSSFEFDAPDGSYSFTYQLYVDGVATGSPQVVNLTVGAGTTVTADVVGLSLSTQAASVFTNRDIAAALRSVQVATSPSVVSLNKVISGAVQSITLTANSAGISTDRDIASDTQQIALSALTASVSVGGGVYAALHSAALATNQAGVSLDRDIQAQLAQIALTANTANVSQGIQAQSQAVELSTYQAGISIDIQIQGSLQNTSLTTLAAAVGLGSNVEAFTQSITLTPHGVTLELDTSIQAGIHQMELGTFGVVIDSGESPLLVPGLEYTLPNNRLHYTLPINRIHFTFNEED